MPIIEAAMRHKQSKPKAIEIEAVERLSANCSGPDQFTRMTEAMRHILTVPRTEILRREAEYNLQKALRPVKRGPKKKTVMITSITKPACPDPAAAPQV